MDPTTEHAPCAAWSQHAAELAAPLAAELQQWSESPTMDTLVADGYLHRLVPGIFVPPDMLGSAVRRALLLGAAVGAQLRRHHVIAGTSAAWVIVGGSPPSPAEMLTAAHRSPLAGVLVRHSSATASEIETLGGAPITSPVRTAIDLLRFAEPSTAQHAVRSLLESGHITEREVRGGLSTVDHHYLTRTARERLRSVLSGERTPVITPRRAQDADSGAAAATGFPSAVTR